MPVIPGIRALHIVIRRLSHRYLSLDIALNILFPILNIGLTGHVLDDQIRLLAGVCYHVRHLLRLCFKNKMNGEST